MSIHTCFNQYKNCDGAHVGPSQYKPVAPKPKHVALRCVNPDNDDLYFGIVQQVHASSCINNPCTCFSTIR
ncbi:MAG: hypothetical protein V4478_00635 [Patescibacteria group bacterium]